MTVMSSILTKKAKIEGYCHAFIHFDNSVGKGNCKVGSKMFPNFFLVKVSTFAMTVFAFLELLEEFEIVK